MLNSKNQDSTLTAGYLLLIASQERQRTAVQFPSNTRRRSCSEMMHNITEYQTICHDH